MAEPSPKAPEIRTFLEDTFGFNAPDYIRINKCVPAPIGCGGDADKFRDQLSMTEYQITGLCQACQDKIFDAPDVPDFEPFDSAREEKTTNE